MRKKININKRKKLETKYIIIIFIGIIVFLLAFFSFTIKDNRNLTGIEKVTKDSVLFVTKILIYPFDYIAKNVNEFLSLKEVYKENEILKKNLDRYDYIYNQNVELKRQNDEMKKLLDIDYTIDEYDYVNASIISRNIDYWYDTITINKGGKSGVKKNMAVVSSKGLVGKIIKVSNYTSDVKLITSSNTNNKISVIINNDSNVLYGVLSGYDSKSGLLLIEGISDTTDVKIGSDIYTSGLNDMLPSGIIIGKVSKIEKDNYGLSIIVHAKSNAYINDISMLSVLKRKEGK